MKILVTGSSGHLGEAIVRKLRESKCEVVSLDVRPSPYTSMIGSINDRECLRTCMADVNTVFHAATLHKPHVATHSMQEFGETNFHGTLALLEEATTAGVASFVFTSTTSVFGDAIETSTATSATCVPPVPSEAWPSLRDSSHVSIFPGGRRR